MGLSMVSHRPILDLLEADEATPHRGGLLRGHVRGQRAAEHGERAIDVVPRLVEEDETADDGACPQLFHAVGKIAHSTFGGGPAACDRLVVT